MNVSKMFTGVLAVCCFMAISCGGGSGGSNPQKALIGQWETVESTMDRDLVEDRVEFLSDGNGLSEAANIRGIGAFAASFTWRIDSDGRLIMTLPGGISQISTIAELSKTTLILESDVPVFGKMRTTYSKRGAKPASVPPQTQEAEPVTADESFTDSRDGKKYRTVKIGNQTWMAENLNFKMDESICSDKKEANCQKYGRLYGWDAAMKACPAGWRLPTNNDWNALINFAGGEKAAGKKLKSKAGWNNNGNGTDDFGFSALPGGNYQAGENRDTGEWMEGGFPIGECGSWQSATMSVDDVMGGRSTWFWYMSKDNNSVLYGVDLDDGHNAGAHSVRCVQ